MRTISYSGFQACRSLSLFLVPLALATTVAVAGPPPVKSTRPIVSSIIVRDNTSVSSETIKTQMKTRVGKQFDEYQLQEDLRTLYATRRFVKVFANKFEDGPGRIKVVVYVRE